MIDIKSLSADWIAGKRKKYRKDPNLMESMIHALYLLEQLQLTGLDFIFKGGTSLILLMETPKRFSVDIDIIVSPGINRAELEQYLSKVATTGVFVRMELDEKRNAHASIPKAHYSFVYHSKFPNKNSEGKVISNAEREIMLDVLFSDNHYPVLMEKQLATEWLLQTGELTMVKTPDINSIAGDKLSAFAPNTTGIPYKMDKEKEILKQLFDVGCLFHLLSDMKVFKESFIACAKEEIRYRPERNIRSVEQVLNDIIETALLIARKDILKRDEEKEKFGEIHRGMNQFRHFVFEGKFDMLEVQVAGAKAAYLAAIILTDHQEAPRKFDKTIPLDSYMIKHPDYNYLNKRLKFVAGGEALYYWFHTVNLLFVGNE